MTHVPWHSDDVKDGDSIELISVGIDIGTTTTHLMLSRLIATRKGGLSSFHISNDETIYESDILLTPYINESEIDLEPLDEFIQQSYEEAGYTPDEIDTGAVITTGEACKKKNADKIIDFFSEQSGKFVCATAGANLETLMAAHGSGAVDYSATENEDVLHIDIGGGTTKFAYLTEGFVEETASINVGARLITFDDDNTITHIEEAAEKIAEELDIKLQEGRELSKEAQRQLADQFAELIFEIVDGNISPLAESLLVTDILTENNFESITFSGGGAEYIYDRDPGYYNDLGKELGDAIRRKIRKRTINMPNLEVGIRATAIGSTQHTVQLSGNTIFITNEKILPKRNIPIVPFAIDHQETQLEEKLTSKLKLYDIDEFDKGFAFGFHLHGPPSSDFLKKVTNAAVASWKQLDGENPFILAFDSDVGRTTGQMASRSISAPIISVDGVNLEQFGYLDLGEPIYDSNGVTVPVTIKSLVFEG